MKKLLFLFVFGLNLVVASNAMKRTYGSEKLEEEPDFKRQCYDLPNDEDREHWSTEAQASSGDETDDSSSAQTIYRIDSPDQEIFFAEDLDPSTDIEMGALNFHGAKDFVGTVIQEIS